MWYSPPARKDLQASTFALMQPLGMKHSKAPCIIITTTRSRQYENGANGLGFPLESRPLSTNGSRQPEHTRCVHEKFVESAWIGSCCSTIEDHIRWLRQAKSYPKPGQKIQSIGASRRSPRLPDCFSKNSINPSRAHSPVPGRTHA